MKTKKLLEKLDLFENLLADYAYVELKSKDAVGLKQKFEVFKTDLNSKIFNEPSNSKSDTNTRDIEPTSLLSKRVFKNAQNTLTLLELLKKAEFSQEQEDIIQNMEINNLILMELSMNILNKQNNATL